MLIIVNCKAFVAGKEAVKLAKICESAAKKTKSSIGIAVQAADISAVAKAVSIPVFAQHVDAIERGAHTGSVLIESVKEAGALGSLLNHSEKQLSDKAIRASIELLKKQGLLSIVCVETQKRAVTIAKFKPDMIAIEPRELIGGKTSVSKAKPHLITKTTQSIHDIPILCGAGINSREDVKKAFELGAKGILVASAVVKAKNPKKALLHLLTD